MKGHGNRKEPEIGSKYGRLIFLEPIEWRLRPMPSHKNPHHYLWGRFKCDCGKIIENWVETVKSGNTKSCGCFMLETVSQIRKTHGLSRHPLHVVWTNMKRRCSAKEGSKFYEPYVRRGIKVCDEWNNDFKTFYDWAMANGYQTGLYLDRENNDLGYNPYNCRFVAPLISGRNIQKIRFATYKGETRCVSEWAEITGIPSRTIRDRIDKGWSTDLALCTPVKKRNQSINNNKIK